MKMLINTLYTTYAAALGIIFMVFGMSIVFLIDNLSKGFVFKGAHAISKIMCTLLFIDMKVYGEIPAIPGMILVSNHTSATDMLAWGVASRGLPTTTIAASKYFGFWKGFLFGTLLKRTGAMGILREIDELDEEARRNHNDRALEFLPERLNQGIHILIFPEGTRTIDGTIGKFRSMIFYKAIEYSVPVVPIHVSESCYWYNPKNGWLFNWWHRSIDVHIGLPITDHLEISMTPQDLRDVARSTILSRRT